MRRSLILGLALVAGVAIRDASAQSAAPPVELGLDVSTAFLPRHTGLQRGPRLVVDFDGRNGIQMTASLQALSPWEASAQKETDLYLVAYRRLVHAAGPVRIFATLGGGLERTVIATSAVTFGDPPVTFPATKGSEVLPAFTTGAAINFRVASRAAIVVESSFVMKDSLGARFSGGLLVPVGSYRSRPGGLGASVPWVKLETGERAWVTTGDGREVDGEVVGLSAAAMTLRTRTGTMTFAADDVRGIDTTDPIRNGTVLGATIGGVGGLALSIPVSLLYCLLENCDAGDVLVINGTLIGMGAGVGAATGALADSLREGRVPLYRRGGSAKLLLTPIVGGHRVGGRAVIRW